MYRFITVPPAVSFLKSVSHHLDPVWGSSSSTSKSTVHPVLGVTDTRVFYIGKTGLVTFPDSLRSDSGICTRTTLGYICFYYTMSDA